MNKEIIKEWVSALRSGEYKQGKGKLRDPEDRYCCLGILCEIAAKYNVIHPASLPIGMDQYYYGSEGGFLPESVQNWAGLTTRQGKYGSSNNPFERNDLAENNDDGFTFSQIADIIESNPPGLFVEE